MRPLREMHPEQLADAPGLASDLDDTLTHHQHGLPWTALRAIEALAAQGVPCVIATGRPAGWAQVLAALLPVRAVVAENGGAWALREGRGVRVAFLDEEGARREGLARSRAMAETLRTRFPALTPVEEWAGRATDVVLDVGERASVPRPVVEAALAEVRDAGLFAVASTVHLHISHRAPDKTLGLRAALTDLGMDPAQLAPRWIYVGDSPNDAPAFAAVERSVGVRNVTRFAMPSWPAWVTEREGPEGFCELADAMLAARSARR